MRLRYLLLFAAALAAGLGTVSCADDEATEPATDTAATALALHATFHRPDPERIPSQLATNPGEPWGDYVGSIVCKRCHEEDYRRWRGSFHSRTLYDAAEETVFGDFSGEQVFDDRRREFIVRPYSRKDPATGRTRFYMDIRWRTVAEGGSGDPRKADTYGSGILPDLSQRTFEVLYAFGNRRHQPYVVRDPAGQHWVPPIYWNDVEREWRYDGWRPYVRSCGTCHVTGIKTAAEPAFPGQPWINDTHPRRWNLAPGEEGWAEGAVGCEVCHGPGRVHVDAVDRMGVEAYRAGLESATKEPTIYDGRRGTYDHRLDQCGQCHNFFTESPCTWVPGPQGFDREPRRRPLKPSRGRRSLGDAPGMQFYADGSHMSPCTVIAVYRKSKMYRKQVGCGDCHDPHGTDHWADLKAPVEDNTLCLGCHKDLESIEAQVAHSRHGAESPGNLCVECHMPRHMVFTNGEEMMSDRIHSHAFSVPTGKRRPGGPPSACNICHEDRSHKWTREVLGQWAAEAQGSAEATGK